MTALYMTKDLPLLVQALDSLCHGAVWAISGDDYSTVDWQDKVQAKPDEASVIAEIARISALPVAVYLDTFVMLGRLTDAEYSSIMQAAQMQLGAGNGQLARWIDMARTATQGINLADPTTSAAKAALVTAGLLTQDRADAVFAS